MEQELTCPKCGAKPPIYIEDGRHNFCPSSEYIKGRIVDLCMKCKMEEVVAYWHGKSFPKTKG